MGQPFAVEVNGEMNMDEFMRLLPDDEPYHAALVVAGVVSDFWKSDGNGDIDDLEACGADDNVESDDYDPDQDESVTPAHRAAAALQRCHVGHAWFLESNLDSDQREKVLGVLTAMAGGVPVKNVAFNTYTVESVQGKPVAKSNHAFGADIEMWRPEWIGTVAGGSAFYTEHGDRSYHGDSLHDVAVANLVFRFGAGEKK